MSDGRQHRVSEEKKTVSGRDNSAFVLLVKKASQGDRDALVDLCKAIVKGVLFRTTHILGNQENAEDVAQEVILRVCGNIQDLKEPAAFNVWLNSIIINEANRYMSKNSRHGVVLNIEDYQDEFLEVNDDFLPQEYALRESDRRAVIRIIDNLPGQQRKAILLYFYDGLTLAEAAKVMGVSQPRVSRCLKFAQEKIKNELTKHAGAFEGAAYGLALLPLEPLLAQVLHQEAALFASMNAAWAQGVVSNCTVAGGSAVVKSASGMVAAKAAEGAGAKAGQTATTSNVASTVATVAAVVAVSAGIWFGAPLMQAPPDPPPVVSSEYNIYFSGGDAEHEYINPREAVARADTDYGEMIALKWRITSPEDDAVLYEGNGGLVDEALNKMISLGETGVYIVSFDMQDVGGDTYTLSRQFAIES